MNISKIVVLARFNEYNWYNIQIPSEPEPISLVASLDSIMAFASKGVEITPSSKEIFVGMRSTALFEETQILFNKLVEEKKIFAEASWKKDY